MLTLKGISEETGLHLSALNRYLADPAVRTVLGGGTSHPRYPEESRPMFQRIADLHKAKQIKPGTLAATLRALPPGGQVRPDQPAPDQRPASESEIRNPDSAHSLTVSAPAATALLERVVEMVADRIGQKVLPPPDDRLINAAEAAQLLCCTPRRVPALLRRGEVLPVRRGVWKRSSILIFIRDL